MAETTSSTTYIVGETANTYSLHNDTALSSFYFVRELFFDKKQKQQQQKSKHKDSLCETEDSFSFPLTISNSILQKGIKILKWKHNLHKQNCC